MGWLGGSSDLGWFVWDWMVWDGLTCRSRASGDLQENNGYGQSLFVWYLSSPRGRVHKVANVSHQREPPLCQICYHPLAKGFPGGSDSEESTCSAAKPGLIPGLGRSPGKDFMPIPGLYAAGADSCNIYDDSYMFLLPGNSMGYAVNTGRIAGMEAAEYIED